jgi:hypothetical protein
VATRQGDCTVCRELTLGVLCLCAHTPPPLLRDLARLVHCRDSHSTFNPAQLAGEAGLGTGGRDTLDIDGQEFQLRTADAISEADTSCYTDTVRLSPSLLTFARCSPTTRRERRTGTVGTTWCLRLLWELMRYAALVNFYLTVLLRWIPIYGPRSVVVHRQHSHALVVPRSL